MAAVDKCCTKCMKDISGLLKLKFQKLQKQEQAFRKTRASIKIPKNKGKLSELKVFHVGKKFSVGISVNECRCYFKAVLFHVN